MTTIDDLIVLAQKVTGLGHPHRHRHRVGGVSGDKRVVDALFRLSRPSLETAL